MPSRQRELDRLLLHEPGEVGFFEAVKLVQERIQFASDSDEAGRALLEQGQAAEARARFEEGVELTEFSQGKEANMWRVVLRDKQKTAPIHSDTSTTSRCLGSRNPGDRVHVDFSKGDWVRLHADEGWGEAPAWMIINRSGTAAGMGVMLEPEVSAQMRTRARELYLSLRLSAARACLALDDGTHAALHATAALLFDEECHEAVLLRALAYISSDSETRIEEARDDLERLLQLQPENQELREHLRRAKERLGEHQQEEDLRKSTEAQQREEEEARQRDLREVEEMRQKFREKAEERRLAQEKEEAIERARREEEAEAAQAAGGVEEEAADRPKGTFALLAQVSRLASAVPRQLPALQDTPGLDLPAPEAGSAASAEAAAAAAAVASVPPGAGRGLGLRSRVLGGGRGRGLFGGRGRGAPAPERPPPERPALEPPMPSVPEEVTAYQPQASGSSDAYPSPSGAPVARGAPARVIEDPSTESVDRGVWRRVLAKPKKDAASGMTQRQLRSEEGGEVLALRKELRQLNRQKVRAVDEEDFQKAKELKVRHAEVAAKLKTAELVAKDKAASRLANLKDEVRHFEAQIREASEAGDIDRAVEIRQRRDKIKAELRRLEWTSAG